MIAKTFIRALFTFTSITNRVTGLALTGYYLGFGMLCFYSKKDELFKKYESLD